MTKKLIATMALGAAALTGVLIAADSAREQKLQQAIDLMESKGDLAKAMPMFEDIARSSDRALAARALLYLGQAQERQGADKARATYSRIVNEFGTQTETVAAARQRLAALGNPGSTATLAKTRLCPDCGDTEANFSPDGRWMLITDWDTGDIAIRDMSSPTLQVKRLMAQPGSWDTGPDPGSYAETPVFSPDLHQIAYLWETGGKDTHDQLRVMANEIGGKSRILLDKPENGYYEVYAWSHDGKSVLVEIDKTDKTSQLAWVSAADGSVKPIKSLEWRLHGVRRFRPQVSPDGRYIVYSALSTNPKTATASPDSTDQHIYILAADGSSPEMELIKTAGINDRPVWTPDGTHILFTSDRSGSVGLWSIAVQNGKGAGSASLVMAGTGTIFPLGITRTGSYRYSLRENTIEQVSILEIGSGANAQGRAARISESFVGVRPTWSPDGKSVAFKRHHPGSTDAYDLVFHSLETGDERTYLTSLGTTGNGQVAWFHDGSSMMTGIRRADGSGAFYRIDLKSGEFKELPAVPGPHALSLDDKILYQIRRDPKDAAHIPDRIVAVDLASGRETPIFTMPKPGNEAMVLSPDGRTLALRWVDQTASPRQTHIARIAADGSGYRDLYVGPATGQGNLAWTADGRGILFDQPHDDKFRILRLPAEGGAPEFTGVELPSRIQNLDVSPDGSRIAFSSARTVDELWTLDNVLSLVK